MPLSWTEVPAATGRGQEEVLLEGNGGRWGLDPGGKLGLWSGRGVGGQGRGGGRRENGLDSPGGSARSWGLGDGHHRVERHAGPGRAPGAREGRSPLYLGAL